MNDEQRKAMFAQMRENATEVNLDSDGVFKKEQPKTDRKIILERQFSRAKEMKDKHDEWQRSQNDDVSEEEDEEENLHSFVTLEDGTSVRWTPELEKTLLKLQNQRFAKELEREYGLKQSEKDRIREKVENKKYEKDLEEEFGLSEEQVEELEEKIPKKVRDENKQVFLDELEINPNFNSSVAEIIR